MGSQKNCLYIFGRMASSLTAHFQGGEQKLPPVADNARISDRVVSCLGLNPGSFSLNGTNTYLVGTGPKKLLIDTGEGRDSYVPNLEKAMELAGCKEIEKIIVTHWHFDHLGGVPSVIKRFGDIPVLKFMPSEGAEITTPGGGEGAIHPYSIWPEEKFIPIKDGEIIKTEGATLRAIFTPGHANDHVCLYLEEEDALFTGDNVLGVGTAVFRDLNAYMDSLYKMAGTKAKRLYPAHGQTVEDGADKLAEYIRHRQIRIDQIKEVLQKSAPNEASGLTAEQITRTIYTDTPEKLINAATANSILVLQKLVADGSAGCSDTKKLRAAKWFVANPGKL